jgi:AraC-like DNA-binding protein
VNLHQLDQLARIHCTYEEIAAVLGCSTDTLARRFAERIEKGREEGKMSLRRVQFRAALLGSTTMMIWLGKQHLGQADQSKVQVGDLESLSDQELEALAAGKAPR